MTPFEQGYADRRNGAKREDNPFDSKTCPYSFKRWNEGWGRS